MLSPRTTDILIAVECESLLSSVLEVKMRGVLSRGTLKYT